MPEEALQAPQQITLDDCYQRILANPAPAAAALNDTRAVGLLRILTEYLATKAQ